MNQRKNAENSIYTLCATRIIKPVDYTHSGKMDQLLDNSYILQNLSRYLSYQDNVSMVKTDMRFAEMYTRYISQYITDDLADDVVAQLVHHLQSNIIKLNVLGGKMTLHRSTIAAFSELKIVRLQNITLSPDVIYCLAMNNPNMVTLCIENVEYDLMNFCPDKSVDQRRNKRQLNQLRRLKICYDATILTLLKMCNNLQELSITGLTTYDVEYLAEQHAIVDRYRMHKICAIADEQVALTKDDDMTFNIEAGELHKEAYLYAVSVSFCHEWYGETINHPILARVETVIDFCCASQPNVKRISLPKNVTAFNGRHMLKLPVLHGKNVHVSLDTASVHVSEMFTFLRSCHISALCLINPNIFYYIKEIFQTNYAEYATSVLQLSLVNLDSNNTMPDIVNFLNLYPNGFKNVCDVTLDYWPNMLLETFVDSIYERFPSLHFLTIANTHISKNLNEILLKYPLLNVTLVRCQNVNYDRLLKSVRNLKLVK